MACFTPREAKAPGPRLPEVSQEVRGQRLQQHQEQGEPACFLGLADPRACSPLGHWAGSVSLAEGEKFLRSWRPAGQPGGWSGAVPWAGQPWVTEQATGDTVSLANG